MHNFSKRYVNHQLRQEGCTLNFDIKVWRGIIPYAHSSSPEQQ